jgi:hypothetical protein
VFSITNVSHRWDACLSSDPLAWDGWDKLAALGAKSGGEMNDGGIIINLDAEK